MATVIIRNEKNEVILDSVLTSITPLGFECEITEEEIKSLRNESGRLLKLVCELNLETNAAPLCVSGSISISSIRRISQNVNLLISRFTSLEKGAYQYIAEYMSHGKVVSFNINQLAVKRRA